MSDPLAWLAEEAVRREEAGLRRRLRPRAADDGVLDLAGNDYLGLSTDPRVVDAGVAALRTWGAGATGSRLVSGTTALHAEAEAALAAFAGAEAALLFSSGYLANLAVLTTLAGDGDLLVSDASVHASLVDACRLSRARVEIVPHRDPGAVGAALRAGGWRRAVVVTDSVFSVDGELAPLVALHDACRQYGATLVVDEAHALGVVGPGGRGAVVAAGLAGEPDVVVTATLSKALGSQGGLVLARREVVDHLIDAARTFVFDTGLAPAAVATAWASLDVVVAEPDRPARALAAARVVAATAAALGFDAGCGAGAVASIRLGSPRAAVEAGGRLLEHGVRVGVFRPPSVPDGVSRLRLTGRADLDETGLARLRDGLAALR